MIERDGRKGKDSYACVRLEYVTNYICIHCWCNITWEGRKTEDELVVIARGVLKEEWGDKVQIPCEEFDYDGEISFND